MINESTPHASGSKSSYADRVGSFFYVKPALTFQKQLELLKSRGLIIADNQFALKCLSNTNYYRLRGYWITFQKPNDQFRSGSTFNTIWDLYKFDKDLRLWLWMMIEPIEIKFRTEFAYYTSLYGGALTYLNGKIYQSKNIFEHSLATIQAEIARQSKNPFVEHNENKYGVLPAWAMVEIISFGCLSKMYSNLKPGMTIREIGQGICESISHSFGIKYELLRSWMHNLNLIRNMVAHHERFYGYPLPIQPLLPTKQKKYANKKEFSTFLVLKSIYLRSWPDLWDKRLTELKEIIDYHRSVSLKPMGFPNNWESILSDIEKSEL